MLHEAQIHGIRTVTVRVSIVDDRLILVVANPIDPNRRPGSRTGTGRIRSAWEQLPAGRVEAPDELQDGRRFLFFGEPTFVREASCASSILEAGTESVAE